MKLVDLEALLEGVSKFEKTESISGPLQIHFGSMLGSFFGSFFDHFKIILGPLWGSIWGPQLGDLIWPKFGLLAKMGLTWPKRNETGRSGGTSGWGCQNEKKNAESISDQFQVHFGSMLGSLWRSIWGPQLGDLI